MTRVPIRNHSSEKPTPPRVFDLIIDNGDAYIEVKFGKGHEAYYEKVRLSDVLNQVEEYVDLSIQIV